MQVDVRDASHWLELKSQLAAHGGVAAQSTSGPPQPFAEVDVVFVAPAGELARGRGQVVQIAQGGHIYVVFDAAEKARLAQVEWSPGEVQESVGDAASGGLDGDDPRPLWLRFAELNKADKIKLARQGNAEARRLVLKDSDQALHLHLLGNPGLTSSEVATLIRAGGVGGGFIQRIVSQRADLLSNPAVVEAIVTSPQTPLPAAIQLVSKLPLEVARRIAKAGTLRMPVVQAARKRVIAP